MHEKKEWEHYSNWEEAETAWDKRARAAALVKPIKTLKVLPDMPGITSETAKNLKWKSLKWMVTQDHKGSIRKGFFKHPFKYGFAYLTSLFKKKAYRREGDLFFYGIDSVKEFEELLTNPNHLFVLGFSYCHKPFECPSGRFTPDCIHDPNNHVCQQCFIGKATHAATPETIILQIPTIHYIGEKIFELAQNPGRQILFLITACEMTLEMFGDWGNMVGIRGIGVRLGGRICNTMKAFELSERGVKPGLTVVLDDTQKQILHFLRCRSN